MSSKSKLDVKLKEARNPRFASWLTRNFSLLIGGVFLLPITLGMTLVTLGLGVGFSDEPEKTAFKIIGAVVSYILVYSISLWLSMRNYKKFGSYGYWDLLPIMYFTVGLCVSFLLEVKNGY